MPLIPRTSVLDAETVAILNTIRDNASDNYQNLVPLAENTSESVKEIGGIIMQFQSLQNEFLDALVNRIGLVLVTSKTYKNPWSMFKRGMLEMGETVEEIFVNLATPYVFDAEGAQTTLYQRYIPDVKASFHYLNYQVMYPSTVSRQQLRQAFLSWQGVTDLVAKIVEAMYTASEYDEFTVMKYLIARWILKGQMYPVTIPTPTEANLKNVVSVIKGVSNDMTFMTNKYNLAQVYTSSVKDDQFLLLNSNFEAFMSVEVLATAFNMSKAEFSGHVVLVDSFGELNTARLATLLGANYVPLTAEELVALSAIPAIMVDRDFFMNFDNLIEMTDVYNPKGLYWTYFLHNWKIFSASPFANNAMFIEGVPSIVSVSVSPETATASVGQTVQFVATVDTQDFASPAVEWSIDSELSTISATGLLTIGAGETAETILVSATSVVDPTKSDVATVTVSA